MNKMRSFVGIILASVLFFAIGCGGGTTGTGDVRSARIQGQLLGADNRPIQNIEVFVLESGESGLTDQAGEFIISTELSDPTATLLFQLPTGESRVVISDIPNGESIVTITARANNGNNFITIESVTIEIPGAATPTPAATATPGRPIKPAGPTPTPAPSPTPSTSVFKGTVIYLDGPPVPGAKITLKRTGKGDITDSAGRFSLRTDPHGTREVLLFEFGEAHGEITIAGLPKDRAAIVTMTLRLDIPSDEDINSIERIPTEVKITAEGVSVKPRR